MFAGNRNDGLNIVYDQETELQLGVIKEQMRKTRKSYNLLNKPFYTLYYFGCMTCDWAAWGSMKCYEYKYRVLSLVIAFSVFLLASWINWFGQPVFYFIMFNAYISIWWITLGFLSSFGFGFGLHTFVLYLAPFIVNINYVSMKCKSLSFDKYGENKFICPKLGSEFSGELPSSFSIWKKVCFESFMWGAGTAFGELPPYIVARAARLAGDDLNLFSKSDLNSRISSTLSTRLEKFKNLVLHWIAKIGFIGIVLFASIPNPLFDLAGITCGHMLVPFKTFFLATFIGKSIIKVTLQTFFFIVFFQDKRIKIYAQWIDDNIPFFNGRASKAIEDFHNKYRLVNTKPKVEQLTMEGKWLSFAWNVLLWSMILYFCYTLINAAVQNYLKKKDEEKLEQMRRYDAQNESYCL